MHVDVPDQKNSSEGLPAGWMLPERIAEIAQELQQLPQDRVQSRVNDLFFEFIDQQRVLMHQTKATLNQYVQLMEAYIEQKTEAAEKSIKEVELQLKECQDGQHILRQFRQFQQTIYQHYLRKKE